MDFSHPPVRSLVSNEGACALGARQQLTSEHPPTEEQAALRLRLPSRFGTDLGRFVIVSVLGGPAGGPWTNLGRLPLKVLSIGKYAFQKKCECFGEAVSMMELPHATHLKVGLVSGVICP